MIDRLKKYTRDKLLLLVDLFGTFLFAVEGATDTVKGNHDCFLLRVVSVWQLPRVTAL